MQPTKWIAESKTLWTQIATVLAFLLAQPYVADSPAISLGLGCAAAVVNVIVRFNTDSAVTLKKPTN